jgi:hypothetical protein
MRYRKVERGKKKENLFLLHRFSGRLSSRATPHPVKGKEVDR